MSNIFLSDQECKNLIDRLKTMLSLKTLNLANTQLSTTAAIALIEEGLFTHPTLEGLDLRQNHLEDPVEHGLTNLLVRNHFIRVYNLWGNNFSAETKERLINSLAVAPHVTWFEIGETDDVRLRQIRNLYLKRNLMNKAQETLDHITLYLRQVLPKDMVYTIFGFLQCNDFVDHRYGSNRNENLTATDFERIANRAANNRVIAEAVRRVRRKQSAMLPAYALAAQQDRCIAMLADNSTTSSVQVCPVVVEQRVEHHRISY